MVALSGAVQGQEEGPPCPHDLATGSEGLGRRHTAGTPTPVPPASACSLLRGRYGDGGTIETPAESASEARALPLSHPGRSGPLPQQTKLQARNLLFPSEQLTQGGGGPFPHDPGPLGGRQNEGAVPLLPPQVLGHSRGTGRGPDSPPAGCTQPLVPARCSQCLPWSLGTSLGPAPGAWGPALGQGQERRPGVGGGGRGSVGQRTQKPRVNTRAPSKTQAGAGRGLSCTRSGRSAVSDRVGATAQEGVGAPPWEVSGPHEPQTPLSLEGPTAVMRQARRPRSPDSSGPCPAPRPAHWPSARAGDCAPSGPRPALRKAQGAMGPPLPTPARWTHQQGPEAHRPTGPQQPGDRSQQTTRSRATALGGCRGRCHPSRVHADGVISR